jgi:peptide deformylase
MAETLHLAKGAGLAAPQVGILRRVIVIDIGEGVIELINPKIIAFSGEQETVEGCLSCPGEWGVTRRPDYVKVKAQNRKGEEFTIEGRELLAKAFCHEIDHLDGILYKEKAIRMLTPKEIEELDL